MPCTRYQTIPFCGRLSYRKYGNTSDIEVPTTPWLPLISDDIVTIHKGDMVDIQCVPLPFLLHAPKPGPVTPPKTKWDINFPLLIDGQVNTLQFLPAIQIKMKYPTLAFQSCADTLEEAYRWRMTLERSMNYSHWILFSAPLLEVPEIFPSEDLCCEQRGEIFKVGDYLKVRLLEAAGQLLFDRPYEMVKLDPKFRRQNLSSFNSDLFC